MKDGEKGFELVAFTTQCNPVLPIGAGGEML